MVESFVASSSRGETTPRQVGHDEKELASNHPSIVYDQTLQFISHGLGSDKSADGESEAVSMTGESRRDVPDPLHRDRSNRKPSPHPNATSRHRLTSGHPLHPPPDYHVRSSENIHSMPASSHYPSSYNNQPAVYGQHLMSPVHTPYAYPQQYHPSVPDSSLMHHTSYPHLPVMQHPPTVYHYHHHSPGNGSPHHSGGASVFPHPPSPHSSFPPGQNSGQSSSYGTGQFQALRYPTPLTPQYNYHPHSYPSSPVYPSPFTPSPYGHHYPSTMEPDRQSGPWYYISSAPSPHQYESNSYPGHYPVPYQPGIGRHENSPSSPTTSGLYASSPPRPGPLSGPSASSLSPVVGSSDANNAGSSGNNRSSTSEKPLVRRSYHPNPPPHRSDWVMWAGNVPPDATNDEVFHFFNQPQNNTSLPGVLSVFLISRSCCAFVNFETEAQLQQSIQRFNGKPLRPGDSRCSRLVCRVRRKDDDLKAGVGGQRGIGLHTRWVKDQKAKVEPSHGIPTPQSPISEPLPPDMSSLLLSPEEDKEDKYPGTKRPAKYSSSSDSRASTNSSILTHHFPKRYFILKSLTQYDLDLSVEKALWATQRHNEGILDQAYRTSQDVFLIFSVNKSGEFYGYARMAGPVRQGEHQVSWATRTDSLSSRSSLSPASGRGVISSPPNRVLSSSPTRLSQPVGQGSTFFSPSSARVIQESPLPLNSMDLSRQPEFAENYPHAPPSASMLEMARSAPGELGPPRSKVSPQYMKFSLDQQLLRCAPSFELDPSAPIRAMRSPSDYHGSEQEWSGGSKQSSLLQVVAEEEEKEKGNEEVSPSGKQEGGGGDGDEESWGESFKIEWLCTEKLPFHRTRHFRNPWNHDREVKVSRDGTELEPTVGQRLLDEWMHLSEAQAIVTPAKAASFLKRGTKQNPSTGMETSKKDKGTNTGGV